MVNKKETDDRLTLYSQAISSGKPEEIFYPALRVEMLFRGMISDLQTQLSDQSVQLLVHVILNSHIQTVQQDAVNALGSMAVKSFDPAASALYSLFIDNEVELAADVIERFKIQPDSNDIRAAFLILRHDLDSLTRFDPDYNYLNKFFDQANQKVRGNLINAARSCGARAWSLICGAHETLHPTAFQILVDQFPGFSIQEEQLFFSRIRYWLNEANPQPFVELLTDIFLAYDHSTAVEVILKTAYRPESEQRLAVLLFLSSSWDEYEQTDFGHRLITAAYQNANAGLRKRILRHSRQSGHTDWVQEVTQQTTKRAYWASELSDSDWNLTLNTLSSQKRWEDLWKLVFQSPSKWSQKFLGTLLEQNWKPDSEIEIQDFERLANYSQRCRNTVIPISLISKVQTINHRANCLAYGQQLELVAIGGSTGEILLYSLQDGAKLVGGISLGNIPGVRALQFDPNGKYLAAGCGDHLIRVIELDTRRMIKTLEGHTNLIRSIVIGPLSRSMYSCGFDGKLLQWQFPSAALPQMLLQSDQELHAIAVSGAGHYLIASGADELLRSFQIPQGNLVREMQGHQGIINSLSASTSGEIVVSHASDRTIRVWNYLSGKQLLKIPVSEELTSITCMCLIQEDQLVVVASTNGKLSILSLSTGEEVVPAWQAHQNRVVAINFNPVSFTLVSMDSGGILQTWGLNSLIFTRTPISSFKLLSIKEIEGLFENRNINHTEKSWLLFTSELIKINHRHDVFLSESKPISIGEFDIQID